MNTETIKTILEIGETIAVEFKRCGNGIESDVYETVCSFLNRFGRDPEFIEEDIFRIIVPLNEENLRDMVIPDVIQTIEPTAQTTQLTQSATQTTQLPETMDTEPEWTIINLIKEEPTILQK